MANMDLSTLLGALLSSDTVGSMSTTTNVPQSNVQSVLGAALPSLLNGALNQATNQNTASGFAGALQQHSASDLSNLSSFMGNVDLDDGAKIVNHLFGSNSAQVVSQISQQSGVNAKDTANVLAAAAPLLMSILGKETNQVQQQNSQAGVADIMSGLMGSGNMTSLLGAMLGGGQQQTQQSSGSGLMNLLGMLLK